jgi:hypothetical protein
VKALCQGPTSVVPHGKESGRLDTPKLIFYSLGMPSARKLLISLRAVVEYFKM